LTNVLKKKEKICKKFRKKGPAQTGPRVQGIKKKETSKGAAPKKKKEKGRASIAWREQLFGGKVRETKEERG